MQILLSLRDINLGQYTTNIISFYLLLELESRSSPQQALPFSDRPHHDGPEAHVIIVQSLIVPYNNEMKWGSSPYGDFFQLCVYV